MEVGIGRSRTPMIKVGAAMEKLFELFKMDEFAQNRFAQTIRESFLKCVLTPCNDIGEQNRFCQFDPGNSLGRHTMLQIPLVM